MQAKTRRRRIPPVLARLAMAALAGAVSMTVLASGSSAIVLQQSYVNLNGEGAWGVAQELVPWQNQLATASASINLNYSARGSFFARQDLITGDADFALSGVPFTAAELAKVKGGASAFISAPVNVATMATIVEPPPATDAGGNTFVALKTICDPDDESTWPPGLTDPDNCLQKAPLDGIRIPNANLAAMVLNYAGDGTAFAWNDSGEKAANGIGPSDEFYLPNGFSGRPGIAGRSDPDEITYYEQQFIKATAPSVWTGNQKVHPSSAWEPITERLPQNVGTTRDGAEQQVDQLDDGGWGVAGTSASVQAGIALAPPSAVRTFVTTTGVRLMFAQVQNANGDWVTPTPDSINKAVDAGGDTPLYAMTNKVPGAYPFVWVDHLYAPAHGLSVAKTEGLAMLIRYLATTGQETTGAVGEGRLSPALVADALHQADQLVQSNCVGSDRKIVLSTDPGPLAPATATAMKSIGPMAHCEQVGPPPPSSSTTVTTATTFTTTPTTSALGPLGSDFSDGTGSTGDTGTGSVGSAGTGGGASGANPGSSGSGGIVVSGNGNASENNPAPSAQLTGLLTASKLPLEQPDRSSGTDRLATFLLGVGLYLVVRKPMARLARKVVP